MSRFLVLMIGCLECSGDGDCGPELVAAVDSLDEALADANTRKDSYSSEYDVFIVDSESRTTISWTEVHRQARESSGATDG